MKKILLKILHYFLKILAQAIIYKYRPDIIGITGSVGKTSAAAAIFAILKNKYKARKNLKNYNNEIGVPLSVIGEETGRKNPLKWLAIFLKTFELLIKTSDNYPEILVLEMGADKIGDIKYLVKIAKPKIAVVTAIAPVHLEFFGDLKNIIKEKKDILKFLKKDDWLIINNDDQEVRNFVSATAARQITYGINQPADLLASEIKIVKQNEAWGTNFKLSYKGNLVPVFLPNVLGKPQIYAVLAGAAVGIIYELNLLEISAAIMNYEPAKSRLHLLGGIKNTLIIDDSYNSSPKAAVEAVEILDNFSQPALGRRWAVLGDMLELGNYTEAGHQLVGQKIAQLKNINFLVTIGERAKDFKKGARAGNFPDDHIYSFNNISEAGCFLQENIKKDDLILIKGSQGVRMEKITKEIMAEPEKAQELLCRQDGSWLIK